MKQIVQNLGTGSTDLIEVPRPPAGHGSVVVRTRRSLLSAGTERMLVEFGRSGWIDKARSQPDRVRQVLQKARTDGVLSTVEAVRSKLESPIPLGYCNVGVVEEAGPGAGYGVGDRVVSNGAHAEFVSVPRNLVARIPDAVDDDTASFTIVAAIGLQGVRLAQPTLGEAFVVTGLGLIGLLTVQILLAQGCRVLGVDPDPRRCELARQFGAEAVVVSDTATLLARTADFSRGRGVDGVIITAATRDSEPMHQAAQMCRKRGRVILVGVVGLELDRSDFFEKEITFQVSCSYGPGRYDPDYEIKGQDYPFGFVRWTEQRNFEAVLDLMAAGRIDTAPLVTHTFDFADAPSAYDLLLDRSVPQLAILLRYAEQADAAKTVEVHAPPPKAVRAQGDRPVRVGFIGAGNYAGRVLLPAFRDAGATVSAIANRGGVAAAHLARKFGIPTHTTDLDAVFDDPDIDAVIVGTRHDSHARLVCAALRAGKSVFCEKPLALDREQLVEIEDALLKAQEIDPSVLLMVGFNRRFSPLVTRLADAFSNRPLPMAMVMTVNAGALPASHWTQDPEVGGGRIVGEACHFIDLMRFLAASPIEECSTSFMAGPTGDTATVSLEFASGSIGSVHYFANGSKSVAKERLEVFSAGGIAHLDNFRSLVAHDVPALSGKRLWRQDKGQAACVAAFVDAVARKGPAPIPTEELFEVARVTIDAAARV